MHGVKRTRQSREDVESKKRREQSKIVEYLSLTQDILLRKKNRDWSQEAFALTTRMLQGNPEFYTVWNYRRNIFLQGTFPSCSAEEIYNYIIDELSMTMAALKSHPKVYWIWNHRRWCLENIPIGPDAQEEGDMNGWRKGCWDKELYVVEKMLDVDPRNFHAWNYRRYVLANMPVPKPESSELMYTTKKIEANFSNFSAWHQRSKVLTSMWASGRMNEAKIKEKEFELVRNAMYTDPNDQSVWMYHRWLVGSGGDRVLLEHEIRSIQELLVEQPDSKWCRESIVHYQKMLIKNHSSAVDAAFLAKDCQNLLQQLVELDIPRRRRYEEMSQSLVNATVAESAD